MREIKYDGVAFNCDNIRQMSESEFVNHPMHIYHYTHLGQEEKQKVLKDVYRKIIDDQQEEPAEVN